MLPNLNKVNFRDNASYPIQSHIKEKSDQLFVVRYITF